MSYKDYEQEKLDQTFVEEDLQELDYANTLDLLDLKKELYDLDKLKAELSGLPEKYPNVNIKYVWMKQYIKISKEVNETQHNYYVSETDKYFDKSINGGKDGN